jgi:hypothetical protein
MMRMLSCLALVFAAVAGTVQAASVPIHTGTAEWRWSLDANADFSTWTVASVVTSPPASWTNSTGSAQWISFSETGLPKLDPNTPIFFGVEYSNPNNGAVVGKFWVDDAVVDVYLNGTAQGISFNPPPNSFQGTGTAFATATAPAGTSLLVFEVLNVNGFQTGLAVEAVAVPEPATMGLMGGLVLGAAGIGLRRRVKRTKATA